jgi:hypothetical protein
MLVAGRYHPVLKGFYERLRTAGYGVKPVEVVEPLL